MVISSSVKKKSKAEIIIVRVLRSINVEELLKDLGGYERVKILNERASRTFKICSVEIVH